MAAGLFGTAAILLFVVILETRTPESGMFLIINNNNKTPLRQGWGPGGGQAGVWSCS